MTPIQRYAEVLRALASKLQARDRAILTALYFAPDHSLTSAQLAKAVGIDVVLLNTVVLMADYELHKLDEYPLNGEWGWWCIPIRSVWRERGYQYTLYPEIVTAMEVSGLISLPGLRLPEEIPYGVTYPEGAATQVLVNAYERDPIARKRCIEAHGPQCVVCGFNFGLIYGSNAQGFIHVHHLQPLGDEIPRLTDPIRDLRPVCPNCHGVIHLKNPPFTIEEIRAMLNTRRTISESERAALTEPTQH